MSGTSFTFNQGSCAGSTSANLKGAVIYVNYVKGTGSTTQRYDLKLLMTTNAWATTSTTILTSSSVRSAVFGSGGLSCNAGNPAGYFDGANYYIAFITQDQGLNACTTGSLSSVSPSKGQYYDLWGCKLGTSLPGTMSASTCGELNAGGVTSQGNGFLDPHFSGSTSLYASERNNFNAAAYATTYNIWSVDAFTVTWGSPPTATVVPWIFLTNSGPLSWSAGRVRTAPNNCEEYYKLTSVFTLPNSTVRAFFQMNYINGASSNSPFQGYSTTSTCDNYGAGDVTDQFLFSGLFYGDLTGGSVGSGVGLGSNLTQLYPNPSQTTGSGSCLTAVTNNIHCYGEFPWIFKDGTKMLFIGNTVTQSTIINLCTGSCQANYTAELVQAQVSTDYTQSTFPMAVSAYGSFSTMMDLGTTNCGQTLSVNNTPAMCGLQSPALAYGNCGHLDINGASGFMTCGNLTSLTYPSLPRIYVRRTMVVPLMPAFFNSPILSSGAFQMSGGVGFRSQ